MNLGEIDGVHDRVYVSREPKSRLRKILRVEGDYIEEREIPCPSSYRLFATIDFATRGISLANVAYALREGWWVENGEVSTSRNPRYERTREDTQTGNKIGARRIQQRDESRLVDATRTRVKRSASRCVRPPFTKDTERFSTTYGSGA